MKTRSGKATGDDKATKKKKISKQHARRQYFKGVKESILNAYGNVVECRLMNGFQTNFICKACKMSFSSKKSLYSHVIQTVHRENCAFHGFAKPVYNGSVNPAWIPGDHAFENRTYVAPVVKTNFDRENARFFQLKRPFLDSQNQVSLPKVMSALMQSSVNTEEDCKMASRLSQKFTQLLKDYLDHKNEPVESAPMVPVAKKKKLTPETPRKTLINTTKNYLEKSFADGIFRVVYQRPWANVYRCTICEVTLRSGNLLHKHSLTTEHAKRRRVLGLPCATSMKSLKFSEVAPPHVYRPDSGNKQEKIRPFTKIRCGSLNINGNYSHLRSSFAYMDMVPESHPDLMLHKGANDQGFPVINKSFHAENGSNEDKSQIPEVDANVVTEDLGEEVLEVPTTSVAPKSPLTTPVSCTSDTKPSESVDEESKDDVSFSDLPLDDFILLDLSAESPIDINATEDASSGDVVDDKVEQSKAEEQPAIATVEEVTPIEDVPTKLEMKNESVDISNPNATVNTTISSHISNQKQPTTVDISNEDKLVTATDDNSSPKLVESTNTEAPCDNSTTSPPVQDSIESNPQEKKCPVEMDESNLIVDVKPAEAGPSKEQFDEDEIQILDSVLAGSSRTNVPVEIVDLEAPGSPSENTIAVSEASLNFTSSPLYLTLQKKLKRQTENNGKYNIDYKLIEMIPDKRDESGFRVNCVICTVSIEKDMESIVKHVLGERHKQAWAKKPLRKVSKYTKYLGKNPSRNYINEAPIMQKTWRTPTAIHRIDSEKKSRQAVRRMYMVMDELKHYYNKLGDKDCKRTFIAAHQSMITAIQNSGLFKPTRKIFDC